MCVNSVDPRLLDHRPLLPITLLIRYGGIDDPGFRRPMVYALLPAAVFYRRTSRPGCASHVPVSILCQPTPTPLARLPPLPPSRATAGSPKYPPAMLSGPLWGMPSAGYKSEQRPAVLLWCRPSQPSLVQSLRSGSVLVSLEDTLRWALTRLSRLTSCSSGRALPRSPC